MILTYTAEDLEVDGRIYTADLELDVTCSPYDPGCTYGPPESCYPPEGGEIEDCEVVDVAASDPDRPNVTEAECKAIKAEAERQMKEGGPLWDRIQDFIYEQPPPEPDYD